MSLKFCSLASGSSGNSYLVASEGAILLIDVGISGRKIFQRIGDNGINPEDVDGILITHEHGDHIGSLKVVSKKCKNADIYANERTMAHVPDTVPTHRRKTFESGGMFLIGDIEVSTCKTMHDAEEGVSFSFRKEEKQISILTDTGCITEELYDHIKDADILALEANHDPNVLQFCKYPYQVKRRILSDYGHLSNEAAGQCLGRIWEEKREDGKFRRVLLSHLSKDNNTPEMASIAVKNCLNQVSGIWREYMEITILERDSASKIYEV